MDYGNVHYSGLRCCNSRPRDNYYGQVCYHSENVKVGLSMGTEGYHKLRDEFWKQELVKEHTRYNSSSTKKEYVCVCVGRLS